ncbi:unknown [Firmicutes bacterium CAG:137]|nr:unknown [Firmicutes bacterium CAG:137]
MIQQQLTVSTCHPAVAVEVKIGVAVTGGRQGSAVNRKVHIGLQSAGQSIQTGIARLVLEHILGESIGVQLIGKGFLG